MTAPLLDVRDLSVRFSTLNGELCAVNGVSFQIQPGEVVGLVGESGCGKSATALSILRLIRRPDVSVTGRVLFNGVDLLHVPERKMREIRGNKISIIFQEPGTSLNPVLKIGTQLAEILVTHRGHSRKSAWNESVQLLEVVQIPDAAARMHSYPHQLSGGMKQRIMIAMAVACRPVLIIADEPTTALDVTVQSQILQLLNSLRSEFQISILLITHAFGIVAELADKVLVMYAGRIVEQASVDRLFHHSRHPYTEALLQCVQDITGAANEQRLKTIDGAVPDLLHLPAGCSFVDRCKYRMDVCDERFPETTMPAADHYVACYKTFSA